MFNRVSLGLNKTSGMVGIIIASLLSVLAVAQIIYWRTEANRIENYTQAVLERSVTLLQQANSLAAREMKMAHYPRVGLSVPRSGDIFLFHSRSPQRKISSVVTVPAGY